MRRLAAALLLLSLATGCAVLRYDYRPDVASGAPEPDYAVRLGVLPFEVDSDAMEAHGRSPRLPQLEERLGRGLARAVRATGRFQSVVYLEERVPDDADGWRRLGDRYGVDGFVVGRLDRLAYESWLAPWALVPPVLPTVFPLGALGVKLAPRYFACDAAAEARLVSGTTGEMCWRSEPLRCTAEEMHGASWYSVSREGAALHERVLDGLFDDLRQEVGLLIGRREVMALRGGSTAQFRSISADAPVFRDETTSRTFRRRFALVVGISDYEFAGRGGLRNLTWADDDARSFRRTLLRSGWRRDEVRMLLNGEATRRNVERAVAKWLARAGGEDLMVVYWAGHGYEASPGSDDVYFALYDTDLGRPDSGWRMDRMLAALERAHPRNAVVIADVCYAEKIAERALGKSRGRRVPLSAGGAVAPGWVFLLSARGNERTAEHARWRGGLFTRCLVDALEGRADTDVDGRVTMSELKCYLDKIMPTQGRAVLGESRRPAVFADTTDPRIWDLSLSPDGWEEVGEEWPHAALRAPEGEK